MSPTTLRVGVAQMFERSSLNENRDQILSMINEASTLGCDVAVFPEGILCDPAGDAPAAAFDQAIDAIKDRAKACNINVVTGVCATVVSKHHNRALVVDREGNELLFYQKNDEVPQRIWIDGVPCAVAICSDRWYIEHADLACVTQGANVMIDISNGHGGDDGRPDLRWVRYRCWAIRNSVFVAMANPPHDIEPDYMGNDLWGGHSAILGPKGAFLARAEYEKDILLTADLNLELATRENAERRRNHPLFQSWWEMGQKVLEGDDIEPSYFEPLASSKAETRIAVAQIACSNHIDENMSRISEALETASKNHADVVVFPERAVTGDATHIDGAQITQALGLIQDCVRKHGIHAVIGTPFFENGNLHNGAAIINRRGEIATRYGQISKCSDGLFTQGYSTQSMWFDIDGVHTTVTVGDDLYCPELTELSAYRGMQLHFHLDNWRGESEDAFLIRKHSAINHLMPAVCSVWANAAGPNASGGSLLLRRVGGHGKPNPGDVEAYLPYHTSVVQTGGPGAQILYFTAKTKQKNEWQASRNQTRRNVRPNWFNWIGHGVRIIHTDLEKDIPKGA